MSMEIKKVFLKSDPEQIGFLLISEFDPKSLKVIVMVQWEKYADWRDPIELDFVKNE